MDTILNYTAVGCLVIIAATLSNISMNISHIDKLMIRLTRSSDAIAYSMNQEEPMVHLIPQSNDDIPYEGHA